MAYAISDNSYIFEKLAERVTKNKAAFSEYNMVRMRELIRYLSDQKLKLFIEIPCLLHINASQYPGFVDGHNSPHGIHLFEKSGCYRLAVREGLFPASVIDGQAVKKPFILGLYHIGSLGTFTQSAASDFDYWVIIDKRQYTRKIYGNLEKKLDDIKKYSRESFGQKVSFFIMDAKEIKNDCYAPYQGEEIITAPKIFLKEEFYRTYLMIAGKIPLWSVLPQVEDIPALQRMTTQILSVCDDLIDLGMIREPPVEDILKGLLWHICKSEEDPVKALIKSTLVFSYGFGEPEHRTILCNEFKKQQAAASLDDYRCDPYKAVFDRILDFHEKKDPERVHLIKNAVFFRLCGFPDVQMPGPDTPKGRLIGDYIREWNLNKNQVAKLLSYCQWSESEKLLLEKAILNRMARMYNTAIQKEGASRLDGPKDGSKSWQILKNKTRCRLQSPEGKIRHCSSFLKHRKFSKLMLRQEADGWSVQATSDRHKTCEQIFRHPQFTCALGWIFGNRLYDRHATDLHFKSESRLFEAAPEPVRLDSVYLAFAPVQALCDEMFAHKPVWLKLAVFLFLSSAKADTRLKKAELLVSNSWGELFTDMILFGGNGDLTEQLTRLSEKMKQYCNRDTRILIYQVAEKFDPELGYKLKKKFQDVSSINIRFENPENRPYLDRL